ncbi:MAG: hypothetical protein AAF468_15605 [Pseudomonadota bacterium]
MSIRKIIEECYAAYETRDLEQTMKPFSKNIRFDWVADPNHTSFSGCCNGRDAMIERLGMLA